MKKILGLMVMMASVTGFAAAPESPLHCKGQGVEVRIAWGKTISTPQFPWDDEAQEAQVWVIWAGSPEKTERFDATFKRYSAATRCGGEWGGTAQLRAGLQFGFAGRPEACGPTGPDVVTASVVFNSGPAPYKSIDLQCK